jgi:hypothetical protein
MVYIAGSLADTHTRAGRGLCRWAAALGVALVLAAVSSVVWATQTGTAADAPPSAGPSEQRPVFSPYRAAAQSSRARDHYQMMWGVDSMTVRSLESGQLLRFSYRVIDVSKAKTLSDKSAVPNLLDEQSHAVLVVPTMEQIGQLRQTQPMEIGKYYWIVFSNKGNVVKVGHRVSVVVGAFRADGLVVQ